MLIPDMSIKVVLPFDSLIPNALASRDWAIEAFLEMLRLTVTVQGLLHRKWGWPSATGFIANIFPLGGGLGTRLRLRGRCRTRSVRARGMGRNVQLVDHIYWEPRVRPNLRAFGSRIRNLAIQRRGCRVFALIRMKFWTVDRVVTIAVWIEW